MGTTGTLENQTASGPPPSRKQPQLETARALRLPAAPARAAPGRGEGAEPGTPSGRGSARTRAGPGSGPLSGPPGTPWAFGRQGGQGLPGGLTGGTVREENRPAATAGARHPYAFPVRGRWRGTLGGCSPVSGTQFQAVRPAAGHHAAGLRGLRCQLRSH